MWNTEAGTKMERKGQVVTTGPNNVKVMYIVIHSIVFPGLLMLNMAVVT